MTGGSAAPNVLRGTGEGPVEERAAAWARGSGFAHAGGEGGAPLPRRRLRLLHERVEEAVRRLGSRSLAGEAARAGEWLLDNAWLVHRSLDLVEEALPAGFCRRLPAAPPSGIARVEVLARKIVEQEGAWVEVDTLLRWVGGVQRVQPLTIGELWALPAMLRWELVEHLVHAVSGPAGLASAGAARGGSPVPDPDPGRVPAAVRSLRALDRQDWKRFLEATSVVEAVLRRDPAGAYRHMDFESRDRYRKGVEVVARNSPVSEVVVAEEAVRWSAVAGGGEGRRHVGYWLVGEGRRSLEAGLGFRPSLRLRARRRLGPWRVAIYLGGLAVATALVLTAFAIPALAAGALLPVTLVLLALPASAVAIALVHWLVSLLTTPRLLPKLEIVGRPPADAATLLVVPAMLADPEETAAVVERAEGNWLGNAEAVLGVALLFDFCDASTRRTESDREELKSAVEAVGTLNRRHGGGGSGPFHLLCRRREWSETERVWMGWERKRGKLADFNTFVLGGPSRLSVEVGDGDLLRRCRFVITLDADTILPPGAAGRLIGTLAHPLNRPRFDDAGRVVAGYTVLQPRVDVAPWSADATPFSRIFSGERGLDLYSRAVSDVYQDLFGEGIFVGKGIYDVAAFHRSLHGRMPEGALLSHDLIEGLHGRAGLVSDVAVLEEFPGAPQSWVRRQHRWIRGDWQVAPWLLPRVPAAGGGRVPNRLRALDRWKIADNLRRSLVMPAVLVLLVAGWTVLPGPAWWWTLVAAVVPGVTFVAGTLAAVRVRLHLASRIGTPREWGLAGVELARWGLSLALLPYLAWSQVDATVRSLVRMGVTRRHLLEWTSAYRTERLARGAGSAWRRMAAGPILGAGVGALLVLAAPRSLPWAAPFLVAWLLSPVVAGRLGRGRKRAAPDLTGGQRRQLRRFARRTWSFFESVLGPDDHWLPPDHVQVAPRTVVARRTSPTNIGLGALAPLAAWDLGYLSLERLVATLENLFDTLQGLERYRGHFLNWYDTRRLAPLAPRYVSTVDSGNLACSLVTLARGLEALPAAGLPRFPVESAGLADALEMVREGIGLRGWEEVDEAGLPALIDAAVAELSVSAGSAREWRRGLEHFARERLPEIEARVAAVVESGSGKVDSRELGELRNRLHELRHQATVLGDESASLLPWLEIPPGPWEEGLPRAVTLATVPQVCASLRRRLAKGRLPAGDADGGAAALDARLDAAGAWAEELCRRIAALVDRADAFAGEMDFRFLYDETRRLFRIGYDVDAGGFDPSWYDLLVSEARAASFFAIATGAVPPEHWVHLGRPFHRVHGRAVLLSWSGTLFEYLLPALFLPTPRGSLLDFAARAAVDLQRAYARRHRVPWGISESAYYEFDVDGGFRYQAFGVPELALRRTVQERLVVAPYASCLASTALPGEVSRNLDRLRRLGALGPRGFFDAVDFGRVNGRRRHGGSLVRSYMAHHQAMVLIALDNALEGEPMSARFLADRRMGAFAYLLYENTPERVPVQSPYPAVRGGRRSAVPPADPGTWSWSGLAERPRVQVLSNGRWSTLISDRGSGGARWQGYALTRWRADPSLDRWGTWIYLQDLDSGALWSAAARPIAPQPGCYESAFTPHAVELHRRERGITSRLVVCVAAASDVELRSVHLRNDSSRRRRVGVTSFGEVVLARQAADRRHPAFSKLFVESRFDAVDRTLFFRRRGREGPTGTALAHAVTLPPAARLLGWESDRHRFLGRGGSTASPRGLEGGPAALSRTAGATLDPVFSLGCEIRLAPGEETVLTFLTAVGGGEAAVQRVLDDFRSGERIEWVLDETGARVAGALAEAGIPGEEARTVQALFGALAYPRPGLRRTEALAAGRRRQEELWALGISGDHPLIVLRVADPDDRAETAEVVRAHAWLRSRRVDADLLVLDDGPGGYGEPLRGWLQESVGEVYGTDALGARGGVHHVGAGCLAPVARRSVEEAAAVLLDTAAGTLASQLAEPGEAGDRLPPFVPLPPSPLVAEPTPPVPLPDDLAFAQPWGGLAADGRSYVVVIEDGRPTPAPWSVVVANPAFGFLVTERGGGFTWCGSSGERRLTPWSNDPVLDPPGEVVYLRDEETGEVWSATPAPSGRGSRYVVRHGAGFCRFEHHRNGLQQRLTLSVPPDAPVKLLRLEVSNRWRRPRRLTVTFYVEWTLGDHRDVTAPHVVTELAADPEAILAREHFTAGQGERVAFVAAGERIHGFTTDRLEFLGQGGPECPDGLRRIGLAGATGTGLDPCAALQVHVDLAAGECRTLHFLLGEGEDRDGALDLVTRYRDHRSASAGEEAACLDWRERLGRLVVETPEPAMDALLNHWLPYQALACRLWARSGFYQASGAFGFRDQLQDSLAFLVTEPGLVRDHLMECAQRQFAAGDVLHWWHPGSTTGVRTRCSDDLLWLPYSTALYVEATGDREVLRSRVPFLAGEPLTDHEDDRYGTWSPGEEASLYEHCRRAVERAWTAGPHGLPLIGRGDWNDGMDEVGSRGRGESVWLTWFLLATVRAWTPLCEEIEGAVAADRLQRRAAALRQAVEAAGWDGRWYRRAFYDDGTPLGTAAAEEARIDSISQSWAVLSGAADPERARRALESAHRRLVRPEERLVLLLEPPFDRGAKNPGYIQAYPPGVRENGGQYTHAAVWLAWAFADLGDGDRAGELFRLLNPLLRTRTKEEVRRYRVEPYVVAADVYAVPPHVGRGGWTWYTGSAAWLWRLGTERILGIRRRGGTLVVDPCIPAEWPGFSATVRLGGVEASIRVDNPDGVSAGIASVRLDGREVEAAEVPLGSPGRRRLVVRLGKAAAEAR